MEDRKPEPKLPFWPIIMDAENPAKESKFELSTCRSHLQETYRDWTSGLGHVACKPLQLGRWTMDCVTLLVRWRDIRPHVEDQLLHEFQEHVKLTQGPVVENHNFTSSSV